MIWPDCFSLLKEAGEVAIPDAVGQARKLTRFAIVTRYPMNQTVTEQHYLEALAIAEAVIRWAEERIL